MCPFVFRLRTEVPIPTPPVEGDFVVNRNRREGRVVHILGPEFFYTRGGEGQVGHLEGGG